MKRLILITFFALYCSAAAVAQTTIDLQKARKTIDSLNNKFSNDYLKGDSVAVAAQYATDASFGSLKGKAILSYWGQAIRSSIKNNVRNLSFTTTAIMADGEMLITTGAYEIKDDKNNLKDKGRYLVVWKQENGQWKLYRDIGL